MQLRIAGRGGGATAGLLLQAHTARLYWVAWSPDGTWVAGVNFTNGGGLEIGDAHTGRVAAEISRLDLYGISDRGMPEQDLYSPAVWSPDGKEISAVNRRGDIIVIDGAAQQISRTLPGRFHIGDQTISLSMIPPGTFCLPQMGRVPC